VALTLTSGIRQATLEETSTTGERLSGWHGTVVDGIAILFSLLYLYQAGFGTLAPEIHRGAFILFTLVLIFALYPTRRRGSRERVSTIGWLLMGTSCLGVGYFMMEYQRFADMAGLPLSYLDLFMGILTVMVCLEACRRILGWTLTLVGVISIVYLYFGPHFPRLVAHRGYDMDRILGLMYAGTDGIFGVVAYVFASYVFPFMIFGAFLRTGGAVTFFVDVAKAVVGTLRGGPAKAAVASSFMLGSVMGSSTANTAITGAITIPLMIRSGFRKHVAGAVEAAASIGGQFMPPVMGAGAFLMAALTGVPYLKVISVAAIPAVLFFLSTYVMVHFEACRSGIERIPQEEIPGLGPTLKRGWHFFVPIGVLIYVLVAGFSPSKAGFYTILSLVGISALRRDYRFSPRQLAEALAAGGRDSLVVGATAAVVGIIIASILLPGLGLKFSFVVLQLSKGILPLAIFLIILASYVLGMGLTVTASYLVLVVLAAPALVELGVPLLTAHLLVFWYSQDATITPPVCLSAYVAAGIAKSDVWKTGFYSLRVGLGLYYIPFLFVYTPLLLNGTLLQILWAVASAVGGIFALGGAFQGYWLRRAKIHERVVLGVAALSFFWPNWGANLVGAAFILVVSMLQRRDRRELPAHSHE